MTDTALPARPALAARRRPPVSGLESAGAEDRKPKVPVREPRKRYRPGHDVPRPVPIDDPEPPTPEEQEN